MRQPTRIGRTEQPARPPGDIALRALGWQDLAAAHALSTTFNWPHRLEDWAFMCGLGRGVVAERDGQVVGTALSWLYGTDRAALGMVGVARSMQGQGLGRRLTETVLDRLGERAVALYATEAGLPLYRALGFSPTGRARQHQGAAFRDGLMPLPQGDRLRPIGHSDPAILAALDLQATGMQRQAVLAALLDVATWVVLDRGGEAVGFALLRRFGHGHAIGPVVAPDAAGAKALIGHFLGSRPGQFIRLDVPEESGLSPWLEGLGLADAGPAIRMVRGRDACGAGRVSSFALISQAFG
jgi:GNAT superfamily N-acetyltransferase